MFVHNDNSETDNSETKRTSIRRNTFVVGVLLGSLMLGIATAAVVQPLLTDLQPTQKATTEPSVSGLPTVSFLSNREDTGIESTLIRVSAPQTTPALNTMTTPAIAQAVVAERTKWSAAIDASGLPAYEVEVIETSDHEILRNRRIWLDPLLTCSQNAEPWDVVSLFVAHLRLEKIAGQFATVVEFADGTKKSHYQLVAQSGEPKLYPIDSAPHRMEQILRREFLLEKHFDTAAFGRFFAIAELWSCDKSLNSAFVWKNPATEKFEPFATAEGPSRWPANRVLAIQEEGHIPLLQFAEINEAYVKSLEQITTPSYLAKLRDELKSVWQPIHNVARNEVSNPTTPDTWSVVGERAEMLQRLLNIDALGVGSYYIERSENAAQQRVLNADLRNCMKLPIEIREFKLTVLTPEKPIDHLITFQQQRLLPRDWSGASSWSLNVALANEIDASQIQSIVAVCRLTGSQHWHEVPLQRLAHRRHDTDGRPHVENVDSVLEQHAFLERQPGTQRIQTRPGIWQVAGDLVLPQGWSLLLTAGTRLEMSRNSVICVDGEFSCEGTKDEPVQLVAADENWSGVFVTGGVASTWKHVHVQNTTGVDRRGWSLTGGITFYEAPVEFYRCEFSGHSGEDAVNIMRTNFQIDGCVFRQTYSDAFDGDFVEGEMRNSRFEQVGGDAFDVSGSRVSVKHIVAVGIVDKAISAGENSRLDAEDVTVHDARIAICSKDKSVVTATKIFIADCDYGLAAYTKKLEYGPASLHAADLRSDDPQQRHLCQTESIVALDGVEMPTTDIDIDLLYEGGNAK